MKTSRIASVAASLALAIVLAAAPSRAEQTLYDLTPGAIEAEIEVLLLPVDAGREFDELDPMLLFGLGAGVYVGEGFRLLGGARADLTDDEADHWEGFVGLGWTSVGEPDLGVPPALRVGARVEVGVRWLSLLGSDFVSDSANFIVALSGDVGLVVFDGFSLVARAGLAFGLGGGGAQPDPHIQLRAGLAFQALL